MALAYNSLKATTTKKWMPRLVNNAFKKNILFAKLLEKNQVKVDGGESLVQPIEYGENSTVQSYYGWDGFSLTDSDPFTAAEYDWCAYVVVHMYNDWEEARNAGTSRQINLIEAKLKNAENSLRKRINTDLSYTPTTALPIGNDGKNIIGLQLIANEDADGYTLGGIDPTDADSAFWQNNVLDGGAWGSPSTLRGIDDVDAMQTLCRDGDEYPDMAFCGKTAHAKLKVELKSFEKGNSSFMKKKSYGMVDFEINGTEFFYTPSLPADGVIFINSDYLMLVIHKDFNFRVGKLQELTDQGGSIQKTKVFMQLVTSKRMAHGHIYNITAA